MDFLASQQQLYGSRNATLAARYDLLGQLYERKQWHQLTDALEELVDDEPASWVDRNLLDLFSGFIAKFDSKLNPLRYVGLARRIARQNFVSSPPTEAQVRVALEMLEPVASKPFLDADARIVANLAVAELLMLLATDASRERAKALLDEAKPKVEAQEGGDAMPLIKSTFYLAEAAFYKQVGPASEFYRAATQYLAHTPLALMPKESRAVMAEDVCMAALVAEDVYDFGELLDADVVQELDPSKRWLFDTIMVFHRGDVDAFNALVEANRAAFAGTPTLNMSVLKEKAALLCLMRVVFERPPHERDIAFADVAAAARLPPDQVEWLVMRAFAKGLLRGTMDEVKQTIHVTWLKPRVALDAQQVAVLDKKIVAWTQKVTETLQFELANPELFVRALG